MNVELELKAEKDNAEVRVEEVSEYQAIVDAEWKIILDKLDSCVKSGANIVLSNFQLVTWLLSTLLTEIFSVLVESLPVI